MIRQRKDGTKSARQSLNGKWTNPALVFSALLASHGQSYAQAQLRASCERATSYQERIAACTSLLRVASDRDTQVTAHDHRGLALCSIPGRCAEAVNDFAAVIELSPPHATHLANYARALRAAGRLADADVAASKAEALRPPQSAEEKAADNTVMRAYRACWTFRSQLPLKGYVPEIRVQRDIAGTLIAPPELLNPTTDTAGQVLAQSALKAVERCDRIPLPDGLGRKFIRRVVRFDPKAFKDGPKHNPDEQPSGGKADVAKRGDATKPNTTPLTQEAIAGGFDFNSASSSALIARADGELREGRFDDAIADLERYPLNGKNADEVRGKLQALRAVRASTAHPSNTPATAEAPSPKMQMVPSTCNFYTWTPIQQCIQSYHTDNDPLPSGPNPRKWNEKLAAEAQTIVAQHPEVQWDRTEWDALAKKDADDTASEQAEHDFHEEMRIRDEKPKRAATASGREDDENPAPGPAADAAILTCEAPEAIAVVRRLTEEQLKAQWIFTHVDFVGVRQISYDASNEHRVCAVDRKIMLNVSSSITTSIRYEIDRRLDGDRGSYVSCDCAVR